MVLSNRASPLAEINEAYLSRINQDFTDENMDQNLENWRIENKQTYLVIIEIME